MLILCRSSGWVRSQPCPEWRWQWVLLPQQSGSFILPWCLLFLEDLQKAGASCPSVPSVLCEPRGCARGGGEDGLRALVRAAATSAFVAESQELFWVWWHCLGTFQLLHQGPLAMAVLCWGFCLGSSLSCWFQVDMLGWAGLLSRVEDAPCVRGQVRLWL